MKYPEVGMETDMPSSLQLWLGQELNSRGIDANVYARYILSILQQEGDLDLEQLKKKGKSLSPGPNVTTVNVGKGKFKTKAKKGEKKKIGEPSEDEIRKMAAIECLLTVTDQVSDIESLIEELYLKLKEKAAGEDARNSPKKVLQEIQLQNSKECSQHGEDPTEKYYAAFPALSDRCDELIPKPHKTPEDKIWAKVASKSLGEDSSADSSGSPGPQVHDTDQGHDNVNGRRKGIKSPPKEEKDRKNLESKHKGSRIFKKYSLSPRDRNRDSDYSSSDSSGKNKKKSPQSRISPNTRYYHKGKNIDAIKGKALFNSDKFPQKKSTFTTRRSFPEFNPPSFIVPKAKFTPKKTPQKYGRVSDASSYGKYERCRSEEKSRISSEINLFRCYSEFVGSEDDREEKLGKKQDLLEEELKYLMASVEDLVWYTKPLDDIIMPSPIPKQRLYERNIAESEENLTVLMNKSENSDEIQDVENHDESCTNSPMEEFESLDFKEINGNHLIKGDEKEIQNDLVFKEDHFEQVSRENSCANVQEALGRGFNYVPPNTPVHIQDLHDDSLGLSNLILLAEQMKSLSQESDTEFEILSKIVSQEEHPNQTLSQEDTYRVLSQEETCKEVFEEPVFSIDRELNLSLSPEEVLPYTVSITTESDDIEGLFQLLDTVKESKSQGIPTPLSACGSIEEDGKDASPCISPLDMESNSFVDEAPENLEIYKVSYVEAPENLEIHKVSYVEDVSGKAERSSINIDDRNSEDENALALVDSWNSENEGILDISVYAASLGHQDVIKQLDLDSSADSGNVSFTGIKSFNTVEYELDQNDIEAAQYSKADCDILKKSHLIWWDISGKPSIWSGVGDVTSTVWDENNMSQLWNRSENAFKGAGFASRPSPLRQFFSPCFQYNQEPRIWDINMQRLDFSSPFEASSRFSPPSLFGQQMNVTFSSGLQMTFIKGGLYGTEWGNLLEKTKEHLPDVAEVFDEKPSLWFLSPANVRQRSKSDDLYPMLEVGQVSPMTNVPQVPSEHSAFTDVVRNEDYEKSLFVNGPLHHVHSEPILSPDRSLYGNGYAEAHYRMIEVKHLYKSDTSILRQLGLASGTDAEETDQSDAIEYSPDRHFVPIKTPQGSFDHASPSVSDTVTVIPEDPLTDKGSLEGSWNGSVKSASRSSSYQLYKEQEYTEEDEDTFYFIPRFKVQKQYEKCAQTGESPILEVDEDHERTLTERLLSDMINVLEFDDGDNGSEEVLTIKDLNDSIQLQDCSGNSDYESMGYDTSGDEYQSTGIASLWEEKAAEVESTPTKDHNLSASSALYKSIWSRGLESDIPSVPTELGTTISNNTQDPQGDLLLDAYAAAIDNFEDYLFQDWSKGENPNNHIQDYPDLMPAHYPKPLPTQWSYEEGSSGQEAEPEWMNDVGDDVFMENDQDMMFYMDHQGSAQNPPLIPGESGLYSSELEEKWLSDHTTFQVQVPMRKPKNKLGRKKVQVQFSSNRKPCSFFLEGSCRRVDCKFAHDMSKITCKFWEEGECFKGVTCPFLHGYPKMKAYSSMKKVQRDRENKEEFKLEKDDFPVLSKSQEDSSDLSTSSGSEKKKKTQVVEKSVTSQQTMADKKKKDKSSKSKTRSLPIDIKFKT